MANAKENKLYRTFVKGLVTEASYLTYPEDSSFDELNTVPTRKGNRTRRLGINYASSNATYRPYGLGDARTEFLWLSVAQTQLNFLAVQNGATISFYDRSAISFASGYKPFSINLNAYTRPGVADVSKSPVSFAAGKGFLFIVARDVEPLIVSYDKSSDTITVSKIVILGRDLEGLDDGLQNDEEPYVLTAAHHYNLMNQGWVTTRSSTVSSAPAYQALSGYSYNQTVRGYYSVDDSFDVSTAVQGNFSSSPIFKFQQALGRYPGNNKQWWLARAAADDADKNQKAGDFLPALLDTLYSGNNRAPLGHYILDQFHKDRSSISGISDIPVEELEERPAAVTFFSGRAWYASSSTVYYSQILNSRSANKAGLCYQDADPTAEDISDEIASDGGIVPIPEATRIVCMKPLANGVVVFAENGVWFINGGDSAFSALNVAVSKVSPIGTKSPMSIVETDDTIYWWSEIGIQALQQASGQFGPIPGKFGNTNIAEQTIQTFYNAIGPNSKQFCKGVLDTRNNTVTWLYSSADSSECEYDSAIIFDITLEAFYPWKFTNIDGGPRINGLFLDISYFDSGLSAVVTAGSIPVTAGGVNVTNSVGALSLRPTSLYYLTETPEGLTIASTSSTEYVDWKTFNDIGANYDSYVTAGYELMNDAMRNKQAVYIFSYFRRTEDPNGGLPSSCKLNARWDWAGSTNTAKISTEIEAYRPRTINLNDVVVSKNKVRGSGKALQLRFGTSEAGKTFDLLGWAVAFEGVTQP